MVRMDITEGGRLVTITADRSDLLVLLSRLAAGHSPACSIHGMNFRDGRPQRGTLLVLRCQDQVGDRETGQSHSSSLNVSACSFARRRGRPRLPAH